MRTDHPESSVTDDGMLSFVLFASNPEIDDVDEFLTDNLNDLNQLVSKIDFESVRLKRLMYGHPSLTQGQIDNGDQQVRW